MAGCNRRGTETDLRGLDGPTDALGAAVPRPTASVWLSNPIHRVAVQLRGSTTDDLAPVQNVIVIGLPALFIATVAGVPCLTPSTLSHLGLASNASQ